MESRRALFVPLNCVTLCASLRFMPDMAFVSWWFQWHVFKFYHGSHQHLGDSWLTQSVNKVHVGGFTLKNFTPKQIPSLKLTWHLNITPWKRRFLLETIIFRGYVSFRECKTAQKATAVPWKLLTNSLTACLWQYFPFVSGYPETNSKFAPENGPGPKRKGSYSNRPFSGAMLVSGRVLFEELFCHTYHHWVAGWHSTENQHVHWKIVVERLLSFWNGTLFRAHISFREHNFSGFFTCSIN